jgi:hypothetical protein
MTLLLMISVLGCSSDGPREAPFPSFDLGDSVAAQVVAQAADVVGVPDSETQLPVTIAGSYLATLSMPAQGTEWTWSEQLGGKATLLTRLTEGSPPDVVVYAEQAPAPALMPSVQIRRFLAVADAGGDDLPTWGMRYAGEFIQRASAAWKAGSDGGELVSLAGALSGGLGFASTPGSFTGWKWVGRTIGTQRSDRVDVRLGKWTGTWTDGGDQLASALAALDEVSQKSTAWQAQRDVIEQELKGKVSAAGAGPATSPRPATMLAGSVQLPNGGGDVYVAAICADPCAYDHAIHGIFESLRTGTQEELAAVARASARKDAAAHARQARVVIVDTNAFADALQKAASAATSAASGASHGDAPPLAEPPSAEPPPTPP